MIYKIWKFRTDEARITKSWPVYKYRTEYKIFYLTRIFYFTLYANIKVTSFEPWHIYWLLVVILSEILLFPLSEALSANLKYIYIHLKRHISCLFSFMEVFINSLLISSYIMRDDTLNLILINIILLCKCNYIIVRF